MAIESANIFQNTSIVSLIGIIDPIDLLAAYRGRLDWGGLWAIYAGIALLYCIISFSIISYSKYYAHKLKRKQFTSVTADQVNLNPKALS